MLWLVLAEAYGLVISNANGLIHFESFFASFHLIQSASIPTLSRYVGSNSDGDLAVIKIVDKMLATGTSHASSHF